jgi:hypothetical protein
MHCDVLWRASQRCLNKYGKPLGHRELNSSTNRKEL